MDTNTYSSKSLQSIHNNTKLLLDAEGGGLGLGGTQRGCHCILLLYEKNEANMKIRLVVSIQVFVILFSTLGCVFVEFNNRKKM